jgi:hypothetical protein
MVQLNFCFIPNFLLFLRRVVFIVFGQRKKQKHWPEIYSVHKEVHKVKKKDIFYL